MRRATLPGVRFLLCIAFVCAFGLTSAAAGADSRDREPSVHAYLTAMARDLEPVAQSALRRIHDTPRQLLAVRSYLRAASSLPSRWSWSAAQIEAYRSTPEYRELVAEVAAVQARFEAQNSGYSLYANTQARSLELQLARWSSNPSVGAVAAHLHRAALRELARAPYPARPTVASVARLAEFLRAWRPPSAAPLAAPGLSMHGRSRAIDFQVTRGGRIIAPTQIAAVAAVWERQGWARKLAAAVAGGSFVGPLRSPNEPWHYEYVPVARSAPANISTGAVGQ